MILLLYSFYSSSSMCPLIIHHYACATHGFWGGPWLHFASYTLLPVLQVSLGLTCYDSFTSINSRVPLMLRALALFSFAPLSIVALFRLSLFHSTQYPFQTASFSLPLPLRLPQMSFHTSTSPKTPSNSTTVSSHPNSHFPLPLTSSNQPIPALFLVFDHNSYSLSRLGSPD